MAEHIMGRGVGPSRFEDKAKDEMQKAHLLEQKAIQEAAMLENRLRTDPFLTLFVAEMEATMLRIYLEHPDGQAQAKLLKRLKIGIDPSWVIKNLTRKLMGASLSTIAETHATP